MYRFGDSTPFPLAENFIDSLTAVVEVAADLYRADHVADDGHRRAREARRLAADELRRIDALSELIHGAVAPMIPVGGAQRESERAAARVVEQTRQAIAAARDQVVATRDAACRAALEGRHRQMCRAALERLFVAHALPASRASVSWSAGADAATLLVVLQATTALSVELGADLPAGDRFAAPLRVADLCPTIAAATLADAAGERRRSTDRLGQLVVLALDAAPDQLRFTLGRAGRRAPVIEVSRRDGGRPVASWLDGDGRVERRAWLDEPTSDVLDLLGDAIEACAPELAARRTTLLDAAMHGVALAELEHPAVIAEELLAAVAPLVCEMRLRSRVPGELTLKRDLGGDRREELFVPRAALRARFDDLPDAERRAFEAIGLGDEGTIEFRLRQAG